LVAAVVGWDMEVMEGMTVYTKTQGKKGKGIYIAGGEGGRLIIIRKEHDKTSA